MPKRIAAFLATLLKVALATANPFFFTKLPMPATPPEIAVAIRFSTFLNFFHFFKYSFSNYSKKSQNYTDSSIDY